MEKGRTSSVFGAQSVHHHNVPRRVPTSADQAGVEPRDAFRSHLNVEVAPLPQNSVGELSQLMAVLSTDVFIDIEIVTFSNIEMVILEG